MNDWRDYGDVVELVIDPALETCGRPVRKLNGEPGLDHRHRSVDILQYSITVAHETIRRPLTVARACSTNMESSSKTVIVISATDT